MKAVILQFLSLHHPCQVFLFGFCVTILRRLRITSTFEYFEQRFGPRLRKLVSFNSIVGQMMGRIGIVVMLPALAISTMIGLDPWISILAMGIITTIYSAAGGFEAVISGSLGTAMALWLLTMDLPTLWESFMRIMAWFFNNSDLSVHYSALGLFITMSCVGVGYVSSLIIPWKRKPLAGLTVWDQLEDEVDDDELGRKLTEEASSA